MTAYDEALRLYEELDGLDDAFIEEGMISDELDVSRPGRGWAVFLRRVGSGRWAAVICGILAVGVLYTLIRLGALDSSLKSEDAIPPANHEPIETMKGDIKPEGDQVPEEEPLPAETDADCEEETTDAG